MTNDADIARRKTKDLVDLQQDPATARARAVAALLSLGAFNVDVLRADRIRHRLEVGYNGPVFATAETNTKLAPHGLAFLL